MSKQFNKVEKSLIKTGQSFSKTKQFIVVPRNFKRERWKASKTQMRFLEERTTFWQNDEALSNTPQLPCRKGRKNNMEANLLSKDKNNLQTNKYFVHETEAAHKLEGISKCCKT